MSKYTRFSFSVGMFITLLISLYLISPLFRFWQDRDLPPLPSASGAVTFDWRSPSNQIHKLASVDLATGKLSVLLSSSRPLRVPSVSPDHSRIVYEQWGEQSIHLNVMDLSTEQSLLPRPLVEMKYPRMNRAGQIYGFKRGGRAILQSDPPYETALEIITAGTSERTFDPQFSSEINALTYTFEKGGKSTIRVVEGDSKELLWESPQTDAAHSSFNSDGSLLLYRSSRLDSGRIIVANWAENSTLETYVFPTSMRHPSFAQNEGYIIAHTILENGVSRPVVIDRQSGKFFTLPFMPHGDIQNLEWVENLPIPSAAPPPSFSFSNITGLRSEIKWALLLWCLAIMSGLLLKIKRLGARS